MVPLENLKNGVKAAQGLFSWGFSKVQESVESNEHLKGAYEQTKQKFSDFKESEQVKSTLDLAHDKLGELKENESVVAMQNSASNLFETAKVQVSQLDVSQAKKAASRIETEVMKMLGGGSTTTPSENKVSPFNDEDKK